MDYVPGTRVLCVTGGGMAEGDRLLQVTLARDNVASGLANIQFSVVLPSVVSASPVFGPIAGGSQLTIMGTEVNYPKDVKKCLKEIIRKWLEGKGSGPPSWKSLCEALRHPLIERGDVASKIEKEYVIDYIPP